MENGIKFSINIDRLFRYHLIGVFFLVSIDALCVAAFELHGFGFVKGLMPLFDLNGERNLPSLFSAGALFLVAGACALCAKAAPREVRNFWKVTALVFLFLAIDEAAAIHEKIDVLNREYVHLDGTLKRAWIIPYGIGAFVFAVLTFPLLARLPANTRHGLVVAGGLFVTGALGFEILERIAVEHAGIWISKGLITSLCVLCEEFLEMFAIALALRTCLLHFLGPARILNLSAAAGAAS